MESVIVRLREYQTSASDTEKGVIRFILANTAEAASVNIHELARRTFVSAATVTRLCRKIGFQNYKDYQRQLACELVLKKEARMDRDFEITKDDSLDMLVNKTFSRSIASLDDTRNLLNLEVLQKCTDLFIQADSITFLGVGASLLVAKDAYLKFMRIKKRCQVYEDQDTQMVIARNMGPAELGVVISYSGKTKAVVEFANILKENSVPIIAITGFAESPLTRIADYNLYVSATEYHFKSGKLASRISQLSIIDVLYLSYIQKTREESTDALQNTYLIKTGREE